MNLPLTLPRLRCACFFAVLVLQINILTGAFAAPLQSPSAASAVTLRVALAGTEPFVVGQGKNAQGVSVAVWRDVASRAGWQYQFVDYPSVPDALKALQQHEVDVVVGPVSITSRRARQYDFTQPYFQSSLSIMSSSLKPTIWQRVAPFFSRPFFVALGGLLVLLLIVGTLLWMVERRNPESDFSCDALPGIPNGVWCAITTMSTVGYGDLAPRTAWGRIIAGIWMIVSIAVATTLVAGIASSLTLSGAKTNHILTVEELHGKKVAILADSPVRSFAKLYGAKPTPTKSLAEAYQLLEEQKVDAVIFDRPQLLYFVQEQHPPSVKVSIAEYMKQGYGFVFPSNSPRTHQVNVQLLQLKETGRVRRIVKMWLGERNAE